MSLKFQIKIRRGVKNSEKLFVADLNPAPSLLVKNQRYFFNQTIYSSDSSHVRPSNELFFC